MEEREYEQPTAPGEDPANDARRTAAFAQWDRATQPKPWWRRTPATAAAGSIAAAAVAVGVTLAVRGSSGPVAPAPIEVRGEVQLAFVGTDFSPNARDEVASGLAFSHVGDPCTAVGGYSDISAGTAVTVGGAQGQTLAIGALSAGSLGGEPGLTATCDFTFTVRVPGGQSIYTVTISHRGTQTFTAQEAQDGINLSLGGS